MEKKKIIILTGPSGAGKTELKKFLLMDYKDIFCEFVTSTTRKIRPNEQHGSDYYFRELHDFQIKIDTQKLFEHEEVFPGKFYGCEYYELDRILQSKKTPLLVVDVKGALKFLGKGSLETIDLSKIDPVVFFITCPINILIDRIKKDNELGKRNDSETDIEKRYQRMVFELGLQPEFQNIINNNRNFGFTANELINKT
jgi:guanylate kinase